MAEDASTGLSAEKIINLSVSKYEEGANQNANLGTITAQQANKLDAAIREFSTVTEYRQT